MSQERQTEILANYLPEGRAFGGKRVPGSVSRLLLQGIAQEMLRSNDLLAEFRDEILPDTTILFLDEWESAVGIPDECFRHTDGTDQERRRNILAKLVSLGVQTANDFVTLAALFGITAIVKGGSTHGVVPKDSPPITFPSDKIARHTILVDLTEPSPDTFTYTFPIVFASEELALVECLFKQVKPAHVDILFTDLTP